MVYSLVLHVQTLEILGKSNSWTPDSGLDSWTGLWTDIRTVIRLQMTNIPNYVPTVSCPYLGEEAAAWRLSTLWLFVHYVS